MYYDDVFFCTVFCYFSIIEVYQVQNKVIDNWKKFFQRNRERHTLFFRFCNVESLKNISDDGECSIIHNKIGEYVCFKKCFFMRFELISYLKLIFFVLKKNCLPTREIEKERDFCNAEYLRKKSYGVVSSLLCIIKYGNIVSKTCTQGIKTN